MKKSSPAIRAVLPWAACIGIGTASVVLGQQLRVQAAEYAARADGLRQVERALAADIEELKRQVSLGPTGMSLPQAQAQTERALAAVPPGITLQTRPTFALQSSHPAQHVRGAQRVRTATATVAGAYRRVADLTAYLDAVRQAPVSVDVLLIRDSHFELTVRVWGS